MNRKKLVNMLLMALPTILGILLLLFQLGGKIVLKDGLSDHLFTFLCFALLSFGISKLRARNKVHQAKYFVSSFLMYVIYYVLNGYTVWINDASTLQAISSTSFYALDVFGGVNTIAQVVKSLAYAVPSIILIFVVVSIFHSEDTDDYQQAALEGFLAILFTVIIGIAGSYFGFGF